MKLCYYQSLSQFLFLRILVEPIKNFNKKFEPKIFNQNIQPIGCTLLHRLCVASCSLKFLHGPLLDLYERHGSKNKIKNRSNKYIFSWRVSIVLDL